MHLNKALPDAEILFHDYVEWVQLIDYEHVPFRCRRCHALGHLFRDCTLSQKHSFRAGPDMPKADGFIKVASRRRSHKKSASNSKMPQPSSSKRSTSNSFETLAHQNDPSFEIPAPLEKEATKNKQSKHVDSKSLQEDPVPNDTSSSDKHKIPAWNTQGMEVDNLQFDSRISEELTEELNEYQHMEEEPKRIDIGELEILGLEHACRTKFFNKIPDRQLENLEEVLSWEQRQKSLGIQTGSPWDGRFITKDIKKRGRKIDLH